MKLSGGNAHHSPNEQPAFEWERSGDIWWLFTAMLLGESMESPASDEALCDAIG